MSEELFSIEPQLSPRLKWMQEHGIVTQKTNDFLVPEEQSYTAFGPCTMGAGRTEEEALVRLAEKLGLRLWNEPPSTLHDEGQAATPLFPPLKDGAGDAAETI